MKKTIALALMLLCTLCVFAEGAKETAVTTSGLKLGMVTDAGTIDDRSFNQGTYEGVKKAADELGLECTYLRPNGTTTAEYVTPNGTHIDGVGITPDFVVEDVEGFDAPLIKAKEILMSGNITR